MMDKSWKLKGLSVSLLLLMVGIVSWFYWQPEWLIRPSQTNTVDQVVRHRMQKNTQAAQNRRYLKQFKITTTPTLIRYQHGQVTRYSGTKLTTIKHLLSDK